MNASGDEFALIRRLCAGLRHSRRVLVGPGDDCALVDVAGAKQLVTIDSLVEGVHFELEWFTPAELGARALAVNLSDIAAMGGQPTACVIALALRENLPPRFAEELYVGIRRAAKRAQIDIVGGNITSASELSVTVAMFGLAPNGVLLRSAGRQGYDIFVTGTLGDAALGWRILAGQVLAEGSARDFLVNRYLSPSPRIEAGRKLSKLEPSAAAIDLSDGLAGDLKHILRASRVGAEIDAALIPLSPAYRAVAGSDLKYALTGGDDYELLFCLPPHYSAASLSRRLGVAVTRIGRLIGKSSKLVIKNLPSGLSAEALRGWDHLRRES